MQYFFSFVPVALKINGEYKGIIHTEPKGKFLKSNDLIEFLSPTSEFLPLTFCLNSPPTQVRVLSCCYGDFIYPISLKPYPLPYEKLYHFEFNEVTVSVICDGVCKIILESKNYLCVNTLPEKPHSCQVLFCENGYIGLLFTLNKQTLITFDLSNGKALLTATANKIYLENSTLITQSSVPTILSHTITTTYIGQTKKKTLVRKNSVNTLSEEQFKYAFLECASLGDDLSDFLTTDIDQNLIKEFIGEFDAIMPSLSPSHDFSLVGKNLRFIKIKTEKGKICDVIID